MCIDTGLRIVNVRVGSDANVGNFTYITDRSASTIEYILVDETFSKYITDFHVSNRLESIHMPRILDFQYYYERNMHTPDTLIHTEKPPKYVWKADMQENYIDNVLLNLDYIED